MREDGTGTSVLRSDDAEIYLIDSELSNAAFTPENGNTALREVTE
jgi:hypothetical protein